MTGDRPRLTTHRGQPRRTPGGQFVMIGFEVLNNSRISAHEFRLYAHILKWDWGNGCTVGEDRLARDLGQSVRSVQRHLRNLQTQGLVRVEQRGHGSTSVLHAQRPGATDEDPTFVPDDDATKLSCQAQDTTGPSSGEATEMSGYDATKLSCLYKHEVHEVHEFKTDGETTDYQEDMYSVPPDETPVDAVVVSEETKTNFSVFPRQAPELEPEPFPVADAVLPVVSEETKTNFSVFPRQAPESEPDSFPVADSVPSVVTGEVEISFPVFPPGLLRAGAGPGVRRGLRRRIYSGPVAIADILPSVFSRMAPRSHPEHVPVSDFAPSVSLQQASGPGSGPVASTNPLQAVTSVLTGVGVDAPTARDLARSFPASKCRAIAAYAKDRGVKNPGGFIRQGLRDGWAIPERYCRSGGTEKRAERGLEAPISPPVTPEPPAPGWGRSGPVAGREASPLPQTSNPFSRPEPEGLKVRNRYAGVWRKAIAEMRDMKNLNAWIAPLYVSGLVERCYIGLMDAGTVTLIAPNGYVSEGIRVHLPQVLEGIKSAGMAAYRIGVEVGQPEGGRCTRT